MSHQNVLILDFGGQYNQLIARRVRDLAYTAKSSHSARLLWRRSANILQSV